MTAEARQRRTTRSTLPGTAFGAEDLEELRVRLEHLEEPYQLRTKLRDLARSDAAFAQAEAVRLLSAWLWRRWRAELVPLGASPRALRRVLGEDRRELWLWVMGDRPFAQLAAGVAGRVIRRLGD